MTTINDALDLGLLPEPVIRLGIRRLLGRRLQAERQRQDSFSSQWLDQMAASPIAEVPELANAQHYEVPAEFYQRVLGSHLKYSCGYWPSRGTDMEGSESAMLRLSCERAQLKDGQRILELGCGWGSLSLWMAENYPRSTILAVSNSASQRQYIERAAQARGLNNLRVVTVDMNDFDPDESFDRIVSIEMFEHMRNWSKLLQRMRGWLHPEGLVFLHFFVHEHFAYPFEATGKDDWMGRTFFSGGQMPSFDQLQRIEQPFSVKQAWKIDGTHYQKTSEAWLKALKKHKEPILRLFQRELTDEEAKTQYQRWKIFFLACAECFGYQGGNEWFVGHYLLGAEE